MDKEWTKTIVLSHCVLTASDVIMSTTFSIKLRNERKQKFVKNGGEFEISEFETMGFNCNSFSLWPGTPKDIKYNNVKLALESIEGVVAAHSLHIWSLTVNKAALAVHLAIGMCGWSLPICYGLCEVNCTVKKKAEMREVVCFTVPTVLVYRH